MNNISDAIVELDRLFSPLASLDEKKQVAQVLRKLRDAETRRCVGLVRPHSEWIANALLASAGLEPEEAESKDGPYWQRGRMEWLCPCGVGHCSVGDADGHDCCVKECCRRADFPGKREPDGKD